MAHPAADERLKQFGENVRAARRALGLSQEALADKAGLDRTYIGGVERGERNVSLLNIHAIADALGVKVGNLFEKPPSKLSGPP